MSSSTASVTTALDAFTPKASSFSSGVKLLVVCAFAAVLRLVALGRKSLTADESFSYWLAKVDLHHFIQQITHFELNMAPYYVVMRAWVHQTPSEFLLRLPSVVFGVATVPIVYLLGKRLFSQRAGMAASLLFAVHTGHIAYSQEARSYTLAVLLCASSALCFLKAVQFAPRCRSNSNWAGFVLLSILAVYGHFFSLFVLCAFACAIVLHPERRRLMRPAIVSFLMVSIGIIPILLFVAFRGQGRLGWVPPLSVGRIGKVLTLFAGSAAALLLFSIAIWRSLQAAWRTGLRSSERWSYWFAVCWGLIPVFMTLIMSLHTPVLVDRFLLMCVPPVVLLAADGICRFKKKASWGLVGLLVLVSIGADVRLYQRRSLQDVRSAANHVLGHAQCGDTAMFVPEYGRIGFEYYRSRRPGVPCASGIAISERGDDPLLERGKQVWVIEMLGQGPVERQKAETLASQLSQKFSSVSTKRFEGFEVKEFERLPH